MTTLKLSLMFLILQKYVSAHFSYNYSMHTQVSVTSILHNKIHACMYAHAISYNPSFKANNYMMINCIYTIIQNEVLERVIALENDTKEIKGYLQQVSTIYIVGK